MPEGNPTVQSQYAKQVDADVERNSREQEHIRSEAAALQAQLEALQKDHELLVSLQATLGTPPVKQAKAAKTATVPRARRTKTSTDTDKRPRKTAKPKTEAKANKTAPPLRELVVAVLARHQEPRSAAEVAQELAQTHPERTQSVTVVRNALEASVAKNQSERSKQQKSVYYSTIKKESAAEEPAAARSTVDA
ncbi:hypothetical protein ACH492_32830 [Streptomyces sp. NPDC019443]|uniref:hypothetical protein n=1 Tax=Streptomyces sp. NPDC019443 TaxID=3365061 RepID=UPI00379EF0C2